MKEEKKIKMTYKGIRHVRLAISELDEAIKQIVSVDKGKIVWIRDELKKMLCNGK